jgi:uncharacterized membrane protein YjjP (DUF1212 family)
MTQEKRSNRFVGWFCIGLSVVAVAAVVGIYAYSREAYLLALIAAALAPLMPGILLLKRNAPRDADAT